MHAVSQTRQWKCLYMHTLSDNTNTACPVLRGLAMGEYPCVGYSMALVLLSASEHQFTSGLALGCTGVSIKLHCSQHQVALGLAVGCTGVSCKLHQDLTLELGLGSGQASISLSQNWYKLCRSNGCIPVLQANVQAQIFSKSLHKF